MRLYEISNTYVELFDSFDSINSYEPQKNEYGEYINDDGDVINPDEYKQEMLEAWFDTLTGIEEEFSEKAINIAVYIKQLNGEAAELKAEKARLESRLKSKNAALERMKAYLMQEMSAVNIKKLEGTRAKITMNVGRESVQIDDEAAFRKWAETYCEDYLRYKEPEINKTAVMQAIKNGEKLDNVSVVRKPFLTIK